MQKQEQQKQEQQELSFETDLSRTFYLRGGYEPSYSQFPFV